MFEIHFCRPTRQPCRNHTEHYDSVRSVLNLSLLLLSLVCPAFASASLEGLSPVSIDVLAFEENTGRCLEVGASGTGLPVVTSESSP